jgi:hypothetical protein
MYSKTRQLAGFVFWGDVRAQNMNRLKANEPINTPNEPIFCNT